MITESDLKEMPYVYGISLDSIDKIRYFLHAAGQSRGELYLKSGNKIIKGRSLMGIFTLDLCRPVWLFAMTALADDIGDIITVPNIIQQ